ncbi:hypothetical protein AB0L40_19320 [Patulibacter sp. NPDC049589]|uniref:hypothetical protein n=1 Tax=Patulibacter sp. NPDC049589 TaxID=3154731 RepID=UPI0034152288
MPTAPRTPRRIPRRPVPGPMGAGRPDHRRRTWWRIGPAGIVVIAAVLLIFPLLGGGRERTPPTELVRPSPPSGGFVERQNVGFGTLVKLPRDPWSTRGCDGQAAPPDPQQPYLVCVVTSGPGVLSIWIYPRKRRGPRTKAALTTAMGNLKSAAEQRDASFHVDKKAVTRYDGLPAIQLRGTAKILGRPRTIRSTHLFVGGREIVIDAYSTGSSFRRVDATVFRPILRSLTIAKDWRRVRAQDQVPGVSR